MNININLHYPDYFYCFYNISVKNGECTLGVNTHDIPIPVNKLCKFLNKLEERYVILCVRGEREPFMLPYPAIEQINHLKAECDKKVLVFNQEPWPASIPNFETENKAVVIKFGYDEGCEVDKYFAQGKTLPMVNEDYEGPILINKNKIIEL